MSMPALAQVHASIARTIGAQAAYESWPMLPQSPTRRQAAGAIGGMMFFSGCLIFGFSYGAWQGGFFPRSLPRVPLLWWPEIGHYAHLAALACVGLAYPLTLLSRHWVKPGRMFPIAVLILLTIWAPAPFFVFKEGVAIYSDGVLIREGFGSPRDRWLSFDDAEAVYTACDGTTGGKHDRSTYLQGVSYSVQFRGGETIDLAQAARGWTSNYPAYWLNRMVVVDGALRRRGTPRWNMLDQYGLPWVRPGCIHGLAEELSPEQWRQLQEIVDISADDIRRSERVPGEIERMIKRKARKAE